MSRSGSPLPRFRRETGRLREYRVARPPHRVKLDQNESPLPLPQALRQRILKRLASADWERYPEHPPHALVRAIARRERCGMHRVLAGHGSNELLYAAALATLERGRTLVTATPSYPVARLAATLTGARIVTVPLGRDFAWEVEALLRAIRRERPWMVYLASPNNPTGGALRRDEVDAIAGSTRALVVVDEAYREFAGVRLRRLLDRHANLVLLRTLSKAYRLAGLRIGYVLGHPDVVRHLERAKAPHSVDLLAQIAGEAVLGATRLIDGDVARIIGERDRVARSLAALPGVTVYPSDANFLLARTPDGPRVHRALLRRGVLVRRVDALPATRGRLRNCLRITVGTNTQNRVLLRALRRILGGDR